MWFPWPAASSGNLLKMQILKSLCRSAESNPEIRSRICVLTSHPEDSVTYSGLRSTDLTYVSRWKETLVSRSDFNIWMPIECTWIPLMGDIDGALITYKASLENWFTLVWNLNLMSSTHRSDLASWSRREEIKSPFHVTVFKMSQYYYHLPLSAPVLSSGMTFESLYCLACTQLNTILFVYSSLWWALHRAEPCCSRSDKLEESGYQFLTSRNYTHINVSEYGLSWVFWWPQCYFVQSMLLTEILCCSSLLLEMLPDPTLWITQKKLIL